ncbi:MAG: hypothetical protein B7X04_00465 [Parcubacteria group bacterium 21-54-25]|nr:MAG: hypothetical protein B7X04_00465 [Parcubacteria group bacterium 21-54-25]HQU07473.1 protease complex subunit PrcB family protein [Candidatus Paceibacterota bacterium]
MNKDIAILGGLALLAFVVGGSIFFFGLKTTNTSLPVSVIAQGTNASVLTRSNYVIKNESDWQQFKTLFDGTSGSPLPTIDFSKEQALAVFAGAEPTGGYRIEVSKITDSTQKRTIDVTISTPGPHCTVTQAQTSPYEIVVVPATSLPLMHVDTTKVSSCQ